MSQDHRTPRSMLDCRWCQYNFPRYRKPPPDGRWVHCSPLDAASQGGPDAAEEVPCDDQ